RADVRARPGRRARVRAAGAGARRQPRAHALHRHARRGAARGDRRPRDRALRGPRDRGRPGLRRPGGRRPLAPGLLRGARLMEPEAKYTLIGGAVLVLLALLAAAVVWLRSTS